MITRFFRYIVIGVVVLIIQKFGDDFFTISSVAPQFILLYIVYISMKEGQMAGMITGFAAGLFNDLLTTHFIGYTSFVGVIAAFVAGFFYKESDAELVGKTLNFSWVSALSIFIAQFFSLPLIQSGSDLNYFYVFLKFTFGVTIYTAIFSLIVIFSIGRKTRYV
ncbi:MAG: rod shape-determining protein MreD [Candidatus Kryptoniota bacterium]